MRTSCLLVLAPIATLACSDSATRPPTGCPPGLVQSCVCVDQAAGTQLCSPTGEFSACVCPVMAADAGSEPAPPADALVPSESDASAIEAGQSSPVDGGGPDAGPPSLLPGVTSEPQDEAVYLFDPTQVRTYNIVIAPADLATINANPMAEVWVPASLEFEGKSYGPYQVRYKGSGSFRAPCLSETGAKLGKCSIKLGFDRVDDAARFFGLRKLNLHAANGDRSLLRDRLGYALFREAGVAAPRAVHARVLINGAFDGLFVAVEQIDGRFTRARFHDGGEGNVYKEVWPIAQYPTIYRDALETNRSENPSVQGMLDLSVAIRTSTMAVEGFLDRRYMAHYLAVDRVIVNDDGILRFNCDPVSQSPGANHNYYWYQAEDAPRFWLIPWDLDNSFDNTPWVHVETQWQQAGACMCVNSPNFGAQIPPSCDPLVKHLIAWSSDYEAAVDAFLAGPFAKDKVDAKLDTWSAQIRPHVLEAAAASEHAVDQATWEQALTDLRAKIESARMHRGYAY